MYGCPLGGHATVAQRAEYVGVGGRRDTDMDKVMAKLGPMPRILCWKCRKLTPFELDHCQHCGSAFAGGTGGAYGSGRSINSRIGPVARGSSKARGRNLTQVFEDLQRVREIDGPSRGRQKAVPRGKEVFVELYQCPACGRIVSEEATDCECGVRFGEPTTLTFACPECGSTMPSGSGGCPVCGVTFGPAGDLDVFVYSCPQCGSPSDATNLRFENRLISDLSPERVICSVDGFAPVEGNRTHDEAETPAHRDEEDVLPR